MRLRSGSRRMAALVVAAVAFAGVGAVGNHTPAAHADVAGQYVLGQDVSNNQPGDIDWDAQYRAGSRFAWIEEGEGDGWYSPTFAAQYNGAYNAGFIRGAYHFARPDLNTGTSGAVAEADDFVAHGGGWSADGKTLPGALDLETSCVGSAADMVAWIHAFTDRYRQLTGRDAVLYASPSWWNSCTGGSGEFDATNPFWEADYPYATDGRTGPHLPNGFSVWTVWQCGNADNRSVHCDGQLAGDQNYFNGSIDDLRRLATGSPGGPPTFTLPMTETVLDRSPACTDSNGNVFFSATDSTGRAIHWTYANGSTACLKVAYTPQDTGLACRFQFYVPTPYGTANVVFGYWTDDGVKHYASLNEDPVTGWQQVFVAAHVTRIEFQDNDGDSYPRQIGWASTGGMRQICS